MEPLFTTRQVAEHCHASQKAVLKWFAEGKLRGVKVGKRVLFSEADIAQMMNRLRASQAQATKGGPAK